MSGGNPNHDDHGRFSGDGSTNGHDASVPLNTSKFTGFPVGGFYAIHPNTGETLKSANAKYGDLPPRFKTAEKADAFARKRLGLK